jgi:hypothetical protein
MLQRIIAIVVMVVGATLIIVGVNAKRFFSPQSYWSDQQAKEYVAASAALKTAATGTIRLPSAENDPKLIAAQQRFDKIQAQLDSAVSRRDYTGVILGAGGAILVVVGLAVFLTARPGTRESVDDDRPFIRRKE